MKNLRILYILVVVVVSCCALYAFNQPGDFILTNNDTAIKLAKSAKPLISVGQLPDTVPPYFPHPLKHRFVNKKFHWISVSPDQNLVAFAAGEDNQWVGMLNIKDKYMKFVAWGMGTEFLDATWSTSGKHLAYTFYSPDRRTKLMVIETPTKDTRKPKATNTWFSNLKDGKQFKPIGWVHASDTVFTFSIVDSLGTEIERHDLQLHFDPDKLPEQMREERKKPAGVIKTKEK